MCLQKYKTNGNLYELIDGSFKISQMHPIQRVQNRISQGLQHPLIAVDCRALKQLSRRFVYGRESLIYGL